MLPAAQSEPPATPVVPRCASGALCHSSAAPCRASSAPHPGTDVVQRSYRVNMGARFDSFLVSFRETDLWIGVDPASRAPERSTGPGSPGMEAFALETVRRLRDDIGAWGAAHPDFFPSFDPLPQDSAAPEVVGIMLEAAAAAGVGPMAAVAGAIARLTGEAIVREFGVREIIVENGGDLWMRFETPVDIAVCAGDSPLSGKIGVTLPPELSPCGVCTSSGTVGPSLSFGTADAAMVVCRDAALADAWATATGNMVGTASDIESALAVTGCAPGVISVMIVKDDRMGLRGDLPLRLFAPQPESGLHSEGGQKKE